MSKTLMKLQTLRRQHANLQSLRRFSAISQAIRVPSCNKEASPSPSYYVNIPNQAIRYFSDQVKSEESTEGGDGTEKVEDVVVTEKFESLHIMSIGINRPGKRNCVNEDTAEKLKMAFQDFEKDENMYCAVFHGIGGNFCAGYDLEELAELEENLANKVAELLMDQGPMGPTKMALTKPVIAAIDGYCVAGGLELAIMCDLRIAEENSKLGFLNRRFGVPLIDGGTVRLPELIGLSRAMDLILTGRLLDPKEAHDWGLVNRVVATGTAYGTAFNLAKDIVKFPQECLRCDRESALHATFSAKNIDEALEFESENSAKVLTTEAILGAKKFLAGFGRGGKFNVNREEENK
eukprot:TRINITY_DN1839_c0_g1_i12.p1 TRINITY_DN1839_c0_g1~~TRINITY_DN1839_c0_g1_i12.p1  ORF type:complete len:349 (-),score=78.19 TRINITY_DN1839_c0_g1_i12:745-1791(-)